MLFLPGRAGVTGAWARSLCRPEVSSPRLRVPAGGAYLAVHDARLLQGDLWLGQQLPAVVAAHLPEAGLPLNNQKLL